MSTNTYKKLCNVTRNAVRNAMGNAWKDEVAPLALEHYGTREAFEAGKAQFINDAMLPGLPEAQSTAYAANKALPKAKSDEYVGLCGKVAGYADYHAATRKEGTAVDKKLSGYFARVADYAFGPTEAALAKAAEDEAKKAADKAEKAALAAGGPNAQFLRAVQAAVKLGQKLEAATWNHGDVMNALLAVEAAVAGSMATKA